MRALRGPTRRCKAFDCGKPLVQHDNEQNSKFLERVCCNRACGSRVVYRAPRNCRFAGCGKTLTRREDESYGAFSERVCCDRTCGGKMRQTTADPHRRCMNCDALLVRKSNQQPSRFARHKYCRKECSDLGRRGRVEILGVSLFVAECAVLCAIREVTVYARKARGLDVLCGRRAV